MELKNRTYGLDVFRAVAILIVVYGHAGLFSQDFFHFIPEIPLIDGVELFFVLSGFLIGSILLKTIDSQEDFNLKDILYFWKRRWFRTLPNYYLFLGVNVLLVYIGMIGGKIEAFDLSFIFFLQNFSVGFTDFFWESWSLSVEEWFYIFLPLLFFVFNRFTSAKRAFLTTTVLLIALPLIYRISIAGIKVDRFWLDVEFRKVVITRLDAIMFGVLAAYVKRNFFNFWNGHKNKLFAIGLILIYLNYFIEPEPNDFYSKTFSFTIMSFGAALLLAKADSVKTARWSGLGKLLTFISLISYSMYLTNLIVAQLIKFHFLPTNLPEATFAYILFWGVTIGVSYLTYRFFEKPIMNLRK